MLAAFPPRPGRVLLAQADRAGDRLASGLRAAGHDVVTVEAYATIAAAARRPSAAGCSARPTPWCWPAARRSRRGRHSLQAASGHFSDVTAAVVTIGPRTAEVAESRGLVVAAVASSPTDDGIVAAVASALQARDSVVATEAPASGVAVR